MNKSSRVKLQQMRSIRRQFWMGEIEWKDGLQQLQREHQMGYDDAISFLSDSTNLDAAAKFQASLNAIPFGISLTHPSIML